MISKSDVTIRWTKGQGPGGQHKNKVANCCVMTHNRSGITVTVDGRSRRQNEKQAFRLINQRILEAMADQIAAQKKARRDKVIHDTKRIRTYDLTKGIVVDHRTQKRASVKQVMGKGNLDLLK